MLAATQLKALAQTQAEVAARSGGAVVIDPAPLFDISPHLYMQFMEPLGVTDPSVEAAWDYNRDDWRKDFLDTTADLAPIMSGAARKPIAWALTSSWTSAGASTPNRCIASTF